MNGPFRFRLDVWIALACAGSIAWQTVARASDDGGSRTLLGEATGPRAVGLGGAFAAVSDDANAVFWNPGGLGWIERKQLQIAYRGVEASDLRETTLGAAFPSWQWGSAGLFLRQIRSSGIEGRDENNVITDRSFSDTQSEAILAYGRSFGSGIGIGGSLKWRQQSLGEFSASGIGADIGVLALLDETPWVVPDWMSGVQLGISLRNLIEPELRLIDEPVSDPMQLRAGIAKRFEIAGHPLVAACDVEHERGRDTRVTFGLEARFHGAIALRTGVASGVNAGATVSTHGFSFDYAHLDETLFDSRMLGLGWSFGSTVEEARASAILARQEEVRRELAASLIRNEEERFQELLGKAETATRQERFDQAIELLGAAEVVSPGKPETQARLAAVWRGRAASLEAAGDLINASAAYQRALSHAPDDSVSAQGARRTREESHSRANRDAALRAEFGEALRLYGNGELIHARDLLERILERDPDDADARRLLESAEANLARQVDALTQQANRFLQAGLLEDAEHAVQVGLSLDPKNAELLRLSERITERKRAAATPQPGNSGTGSDGGQLSAGGVLSAAASAMQRRDADVLYERGLARFESGDADGAVRDWQRALEIFPNHRESRERLCAEHLTRGLAAFARGALEEAILSWEAAVHLDPKDGRAAGYLKRAREQLARTDEIREDQEEPQPGRSR